MANRLKEDEKNEKIIRGLVKLPPNRKCINCSSLGPQYVCTNFSTFICTNCSGIHREFSHRVKSISMAKFTSQEVNALQQGGNERAKEIFLKEWDPQRHSFPDSSNVDKLRTFIKHVYVDRRYASEKSSFGGRNDDQNFRSSFEGRRSPSYDQGDFRRSPADDRYRDDKPGNVQQSQGFEDRRLPDGAPKLESGSPSHKKNGTSSPVVGLVRDAAGEATSAVKIAEPPKSNGQTADKIPVQTTATPSNVASANGNMVEARSLNTGSLIDFSTDIEPPPSHSEPVQQTPVNGGDWASFDSSSEQKAAQVTPTLSTLDPTLLLLTASGNVPVSNATLPTGLTASPLQATAAFATAQQNAPPLFPTLVSQSSISSVTQSVVGDTRNQSFVPTSQNIPGMINASDGLVSQNTKLLNAQQTVQLSKPDSVEMQTSGRKELPADLFTALYSPAYAPGMGWQPRPNNFAVGYGMQYPMAVVQPAFSYPPKPANPFDIPNESTLTHASTFPSMVSLQGALPDPVNSSNLMRTSSLGANPTQQWIPQMQHPQPQSTFPGGFMGQPLQNNIPQQPSAFMFPGGNQASIDLTSQRPAFGPPRAMQQQLSSQYPQSSTLNAYAPVSGNPFG